ncbi:MAG TPA: ATP-binding cassette domain-containing protein [Methanothrix sp.]
MTNILETKCVDYSYGDGTQALKNVSLSLAGGKKIALVGPNGAGKSTLMLMFNGILRPTAGEVLFRGQVLRYDSASLREVRRKVGMVFQNSDDQLFAPTVYQDVAFGPVNLGLPPEKVKKYVGYALQYVGLSGYERRPPHHLSGGEKKRAAIAGILAMEPEVIILDEPTSNLDPASSEEVMEMLDELNLGGKTLIISTHDVELAYRWADDVVLMKDGGVLRRGPGQEVFGDAELIKTARLKLPTVVDLFQELTGRGLISGVKPPLNILELCDLLESRKGEAKPINEASRGTIYIINVDEDQKVLIPEILKKTGVDYTGAMGTSAKVMAEQSSIPLDFTYGVIDKCILKALTGKSSLIMTSGGMVDHALQRIEAYGRESGVVIEVLRIPSAETVPVIRPPMEDQNP